jgi:hypothetical protein
MMRLDHTKEDEDEPETSPHREGTGRALPGSRDPRGTSAAEQWENLERCWVWWSWGSACHR